MDQDLKVKFFKTLLRNSVAKRAFGVQFLQVEYLVDMGVDLAAVDRNKEGRRCPKCEAGLSHGAGFGPDLTPDFSR